MIAALRWIFIYFGNNHLVHLSRRLLLFVFFLRSPTSLSRRLGTRNFLPKWVTAKLTYHTLGTAVYFLLLRACKSCKVSYQNIVNVLTSLVRIGFGISSRWLSFVINGSRSNKERKLGDLRQLETVCFEYWLTALCKSHCMSFWYLSYLLLCFWCWLVMLVCVLFTY